MKLPKVETLIIFVFFACVALWAMSKCSSERTDFVRHARETGDEENEDHPALRDTARPPRPAVQAPAQTVPVPAQPVNTQRPSAATAPVVSTQAPATTPQQPGPKPVRPALSNQPATTTTTPSATSSKYSTLYVSIDGLKMRKEPGLKGDAIAKLALYEPVTFLNQKTEWTQEISLGYEKVKDHWVKVRSQSGKEGWVFGAGVHYYKMKRQGVME